jgi:protein-disulfide isomerase
MASRCATDYRKRRCAQALCRAAGVSFSVEDLILPRIRLLAGLIALCLTAGCKAQTSTPTGSDPTLDRRIELQVRSEYGLPNDVNVSIGARRSSDFPGYQTLPVMLSNGAKTQEIDFLISNDSTKLVHLTTMDLTKTPGDSIKLDGRPIRGNPNAKVTVINFDDLECPFCARMHQELFPATLAHYGDKIRIIYKDDPLAELHPWAIHASVDANCLAVQNGTVYWNFVDYVHSHGEEVTGPDRNLQKSYEALDRIAHQEGTLGKLDEASLSACLAKQDDTQVLASSKEAEGLGLEGTPELYINGERINGAVPQDQLWAAIDRALRAAGEQPPPAEKPAPAAPAAAPAGNSK